MTTPVKLLLINLSSFVLIFILSLVPVQIVRIALGVPILILFPGYALLVAAAPRRAGNGIETFALSMGLSLAVTPAIGLLMNLAPWGITMTSTLYSVTAFTLLASIAGYLRVRGLGVPPQPEPEGPTRKKSLLSSRPGDWALSGLMLASVAVGLWSVTHFAGTPKSGERFTSFYIVQDAGASDRTAALTAGNQFTVKVGVANHEGASRSYRIKMQVNGQDRGEIGPNSLYNGQQWTGEFSFVLSQGAGQKVRLILISGDSSTPYLKPLEFSIDVASG